MSKKNDNDILKKALNSSNNSYEDKLAILRFITKKNTSTVSSAFSKILKRNNIFIFLLQKNNTHCAIHYFALEHMHLNYC